MDFVLSFGGFITADTI